MIAMHICYIHCGTVVIVSIATKITYEPTYQLEPAQKPNVKGIGEVIDRELNDLLHDVKYNSFEAANLSKVRQLQLCTLLFSCLCCVVVESSKTSISSIHNFLISPDEELMQFVLSSCVCILLLWWQGYLQIIVIEQKISKILHHILFVVLHRWYRTDCSQRPRNCSQSGADTKLCAWCRLRSSCLSLCRSPPAAYGTRNLMWKLLEPSGTEAS